MLDTNHSKYRSGITQEFGISGIKLDLGCGSRKYRPDAVGIDCTDSPHVDLICDAVSAIPLPTDSVEYCYSYHFLEHVPTYKYVGLLREVFRVCAPGSVIDWWFPYWTHRTAYNFSHVSFLNEFSFKADPFVIRFQMDRVEYTYEDEFVGSSEDKRGFARKHLFNSVKEMRVVFSPLK